MRAEDEITADARDGSPFSNGTEGMAWMENWCERCVHDDEERNVFCPLVTVAMLGKTPAEWIEEKPFSLGDRYTCVEFRDQDGPGDTEPQPVPDPPDQLVLLPREPYEAVRMLTALPSRKEVHA